jgi:hypothetical protein
MKYCDFNVEFEYEGPTMWNLYKVTFIFPSKELPSLNNKILKPPPPPPPPFPKEEE